MNFGAAFNRLIANEGVLSNHPADKGGLTKYGISQSAYPHLDIANLTLDDCRKIYYADYWSAAPRCMVMLFNACRIKFYTSLPDWQTFGRGWANRVADNLVFATQKD